MDSIIGFSSPELSYQIVLVENGSSEEEYRILESYVQDKPSVRLVKSEKNLGFAGGNMLGVAAEPDARYYYFLNNDCLFLNDVLGILYRFMEQHPKVSMCSGQMHDEHKHSVHTFGYLPTLPLLLLGSGTMRLFQPQKYLPKKAVYDEPVEVQMITGASMFVRGDRFRAINGMDTNLFLYCEEEDLAIRMRKDSSACYLVPEAKFIHFGGKSTQRRFAIEREYYLSLLYYHRKHHSILAYPLFSLIYAFRLLRKFYKKNYTLNLKLAYFVLCGAPMNRSIRYSVATKAT